MHKLKSPFPWFGGKSRAAEIVWQRFGSVPNYVEPFAGSLAVLLKRPDEARIETVNDLDAYIANFWRALKTDPEKLSEHTIWPCNEADLHARHTWLKTQLLDGFRDNMLSDPDFCDYKIAGFWVWGISQWIGAGWCRDNDWRGRFARSSPRGIHCVDHKRPALGRGDRGALKKNIYSWFNDLSNRLSRVRVCCGDWKRVVGPSPTFHIGLSAVFLDPPYGTEATRTKDIYSEDSETVATECRTWCIENGNHKKLRIALCGYEGEHEELKNHGWHVVPWKATRGMSQNSDNAERERIWFSPHCLNHHESQTQLFKD